MIVTDIDAQRHFWAACLRGHSLRDGAAVVERGRYFVLDAWAETDCGPCTDHPHCRAGALTLAGLDDTGGDMFCAADFEPVAADEAAALMASMIRAPL